MPKMEEAFEFFPWNFSLKMASKYFCTFSLEISWRKYYVCENDEVFLVITWISQIFSIENFISSDKNGKVEARLAISILQTSFSIFNLFLSENTKYFNLLACWILNINSVNPLLLIKLPPRHALTIPWSLRKEKDVKKKAPVRALAKQIIKWIINWNVNLNDAWKGLTKSVFLKVALFGRDCENIKDEMFSISQFVCKANRIFPCRCERWLEVVFPILVLGRAGKRQKQKISLWTAKVEILFILDLTNGYIRPMNSAAFKMVYREIGLYWRQ